MLVSGSVALLIPHFNPGGGLKDFSCWGDDPNLMFSLFDPFESSSIRHGMSIYCLCLICPWI